MRKRFWILSIIPVLLLGGIAMAVYSYPWRNVNTDFAFRFFALSESFQVSAEEQQAAVKIVREAIQNHGQEYRHGRLLEMPAHGLHDGVKTSEQRTRGKQIGQQIDAFLADRGIQQRARLAWSGGLSGHSGGSIAKSRLTITIRRLW
jgi:hypothetical protein